MGLINGTKLTPRQRAEVLSRFPYRWTKENEGQARRLHGAEHPTIPLIPDEQWLREHAFYFVKDGTRLNRKLFFAERAEREE